MKPGQWRPVLFLADIVSSDVWEKVQLIILLAFTKANKGQPDRL